MAADEDETTIESTKGWGQSISRTRDLHEADRIHVTEPAAGTGDRTGDVEV